MQSIAKYLFKIIPYVMRILGLGKVGILKDLIEEVERQNNCFITYHLRPMLSSAIDIGIGATNGDDKLAIVLQGPVLTANNFTLETVKLYKRHFLNAIIILSTWDDEVPAVLRQFHDLGIEVILNKKPNYAGESNINLQIVSSKNGIQKAYEAGAEHAIKTRTDQRMYAPGISDYFRNLTKMFPVRGDYSRQKERIVGISPNTFKYRMYGLSDMLTYGHIDDMLLYWGAELDKRVFSDERRQQAGSSLREFALWRVCEVYLATEFLTKAGKELKWSLRDSWEAFADHFCVVDREQLDLFWPKYNRFEYQWLYYTEDKRLYQEMGFKDWVNIYCNLENMRIPEEQLDKCLKRQSQV